MHYKEKLIGVMENFKPLLKELIKNPDLVTRDQIQELRSYVSKECLNANEIEKDKMEPSHPHILLKIWRKQSNFLLRKLQKS